MQNSLEKIITDPEMFDFAVNIYLVATKARKACLLESANVRGPRQKELIDKALSFARELGLVIVIENNQADFKRYLVVKESDMELVASLLRSENWDEALGRLLGFQCVGHAFFDLERERVGKSISIEYKDMFANIAEVCEMGKISLKEIKSDLEKKVALFRSVLPEDFRVSYKIREMIPSRIRYERLHDMDYVKAHLSDYENDLYNGWVDNDNSNFGNIFAESIQDANRYGKLLPLFRAFWKKIIVDDELGKFRENYKIPYQQGEQHLIEMDNELAENINMGLKEFSGLLNRHKAMMAKEGDE